MLQFLYPIGLLAAVGIIVPVVVHLWNIKSGKTLKIGSIALLGLATNQRSSNFKITDWPLLLLRCALLLLIAFLLAAPVYRASVKSAEQPGWILLEKGTLGRVWNDNKAELDSLLNKGYELRDLSAGFPILELKDTATVFSKPGNAPLSYFSFIRQLNAERQPGTKVYLYTANQLSRFAGKQPTITVDLQWRLFDVDHPTATAPPAADTSKMLVLINPGGYATDAAYLKAAVSAIADYTGRKITIRNIQALSQVSRAATAVFWLSDQAVSAAQLKKLPEGISFFTYAGLKTEPTRSVLHYERGSATQEIPLYQRKHFDGVAEQAIWTDGSGTPLLTMDVSAIRHYRFYSRFNQSWTDLVWNNGMVAALMPIVVPQQDDQLGFNPADTARVTYPLALPLNNAVKTKNAGVTVTTQSLSSLTWWLVILIFFLERLLTYRKTDRKV
jgi:hypothetical protein